MKEIINHAISWNTLGSHNTSEFHYEVKTAVIEKDSGVLTLDIESNFIFPHGDEEKIKAIFLNKLPSIKVIKFNYIYNHMIQTDEEILRLYIPHMIAEINGEYTAVTRFILPEKIELKEGVACVASMGETATELLNDKVSDLFSVLLHQRLAMNYKFVFENDEAAISEKKKKLKETERADIEKSIAVQIEKSKEYAQSNPTPKQDDQQGGFKGGWKKREKELPAQGNRIMGKDFSGVSTAMGELSPETGNVIVEGILFQKSAKPIKNGKQIVTLLMTDKKTSVCLKAFASNEKWEEIELLLNAGDYIIARGATEWDRFDNCLVVMVKDIKKGVAPKREDNYAGKKRVELHAHTKMSAMDGLNEADELVYKAAGWGQTAVAITDHGVVQNFPDAASAAGDLAKQDPPVNIKVIYGMEGYVFDDANFHLEDGTIDYKKPKVYHIIFLVKSQEGMKNLYKLVSYSHLNYFYRKPRLPKSLIEKHRDGLIIGAACEAGEVFQSVFHNLPEEKVKEIASFYDYLEIQPLINNQFMIDKGMVKDREDLKNLNRRIVDLASELGKPVVATTDAHYDEPESAIFRNILMAGRGFENAENGQGLYLRTTEEMLEEFSYLGDEMAYEVVVENTNKIADLIDEDIRPVPKGKYPPKIQGAEKTLKETCEQKARGIYGDPLPEEIEKRLEVELNSIIGNGYAVMYVSAQMLVHKSMEDGYLVGSRGSVGSSFAATMAGITEVNPLNPHYLCPNCKHLEWGDMEKFDCGIDMPEKNCPKCGTPMKRDGFTIPFATFLGFKGNKEPDIDLNFAGEYQSIAHQYVGKIFGEKNVYKAGTVSTVAKKTAFGYTKKFEEITNRTFNKFEEERLAAGCTGVQRTTGQHPGGIIIVPDDHEIFEFCPIQHPANNTEKAIVTTHFDYHKIDQNLLKLDLLGHTIPSMIRQLQDMTEISPLNVDLTDRKVLSIFNGVEALDIKDPDYKYTHGSYAIPEFGTSFVRQMLDDIKPERFADLIRISGFSHGEDVWINNAQDYIRQGIATMREVISARDDIMNYLMLKGLEDHEAFQIMEDVRKNHPLKKEQVELMKSKGVPDWYIDSCIKIKYLFPRAHAVAYTMMSFRMAWYKVYYPIEFYATYFTSVIDSFDAETIMKGSKACLDKIEDIKSQGKNATAKDHENALIMEVAYEMYARGFEFSPAHLGKSKATRFWKDDGKVLLPFAALDGVGATAANSMVEAYSEKPFDTIEEATIRAKLNKSAVEVLKEHGVFAGLPETDQLSLF